MWDLIEEKVDMTNATERETCFAKEESYLQTDHGTSNCSSPSSSWTRLYLTSSFLDTSLLSLTRPVTRPITPTEFNTWKNTIKPSIPASNFVQLVVLQMIWRYGEELVSRVLGSLDKQGQGTKTEEILS